MKGDFSRDTFDRKKRYGGVLMQQGRVQLDADWNEQQSIQLYRTQTEAVDVIGPSGAPRGADGFRVEALGGVDLTLSPGRIYVGGLLCELDESAPVPARLLAEGNNRLHVDYLDAGDGPFAPGQWVEVAAAGRAHRQLRRIERVREETRTLTLTDDLAGFDAAESLFARRVVTYTTQPDHPAPPHTSVRPPELSPPSGSPPSGSPPSSSPPGGGSPVTSPPMLGDVYPHLDLLPGNYLVYLHAWQRHVTALEDPHIRETALGGPDTTTRVRNIWQVNLLRVEAGGDCATDFAGWRSLVEPPTGSMNARVQPVQDDEDPCTLPPSAGYRRLENQLYRVEVHKGGARASATFKWSRENGSIQTRIERIEDDTVTVSGLGKDEVHGFAGDQWVEVADEESELVVPHPEPRPLLRISGQPDHERGEITLSGPVAHLAGRRGLKLRRWDQRGANLGQGVAMASADGAADSPGWVALEGGVQVRFSEGTYRAGDYWLIPARTETGDIEWPPFGARGAAPVPQPPRGLRHHYCRLALLTVGADGAITAEDCREVFPPLTDITARDVRFDNARCLPELARVYDVQEALDVLCNIRQNGCTHVAIPGPGWEEVFDRIAEGGDAQICFQAGDYPVRGTVRVRGKGHLKLGGIGPGTRILAPADEAALSFEECRSVTVRDLYAETGSIGAEKKRRDEERLLNGTLTFINCGTADVEHVKLKCASGATRSSACVTVRGDERIPCSARVLRCEMSVGHRQQGALLVDVERALVEDNVVRVYEKPEGLRFPRALLNPRLRANIRATLISGAVVAARPPRRAVTNVSLNLGGDRAVHFRTQSGLGREWRRALEANPLPETRTAAGPRALLSYVHSIADRVLLDPSFRRQFPRFDALFRRLQVQDRAVASQGITVGGRFAREVRILNNTVEGALQGIHVGLSRTAHVGPRNTPVRNQYYLAGEVTIAGNSIHVLLPVDVHLGDRHGIFVGNCRGLRIEDNDIRLSRTEDAAKIQVDGIRVWGVLGDRLSVSRNFIKRGGESPDDKFTVGIRIERHETASLPGPVGPVGWFALENVISCDTEPPVLAPREAVLRDNVRTD